MNLPKSPGRLGDRELFPLETVPKGDIAPGGVNSGDWMGRLDFAGDDLLLMSGENNVEGDWVWVGSGRGVDDRGGDCSKNGAEIKGFPELSGG